MKKQPKAHTPFASVAEQKGAVRGRCLERWREELTNPLWTPELETMGRAALMNTAQVNEINRAYAGLILALEKARAIVANHAPHAAARVDLLRQFFQGNPDAVDWSERQRAWVAEESALKDGAKAPRVRLVQYELVHNPNATVGHMTTLSLLLGNWPNGATINDDVPAVIDKEREAIEKAHKRGLAVLKKIRTRALR